MADEMYDFGGGYEGEGGGLADIGALSIAPGEHDILGRLGVPGYGGGGRDNSLDDLMGAVTDAQNASPYQSLLDLRKGRLQGGYAPTASGVKYIFTGGSPYKRTVYDQAAEAALIIGALRARAAEAKRKAQIQKAKNQAAAKAAAASGQ
jgi:hypothetical protein